MKTSRLLFVCISLIFSIPAFAHGSSKYHCEVKKNGKSFDLPKKDAPDRKACKAKGGKWIKDHGDHDHGSGSDHNHEED